MDINLKKHRIILNILIFFSIGLATFIGQIFSSNQHLTSYFYPAIGFAAVFYYQYKEKILPGILLGFIIGHFIYYIMGNDIEWISMIFYILSYTLFGIIQIVLFTRYVKHEWIRNFRNIINILYLFLSFVAISILPIFFEAVVIHLFHQNYDLFSLFTSNLIGQIFGFLIISFVLFLSYEFDVPFLKVPIKNTIYGIIFIALFYGFAYGLFSSSISLVGYQSFSFLIVIFYALGMLFFSFRMILFLNAVYIITFFQIYVKHSPSLSPIAELIDFNLVVFFISFIAVYAKITYNEIQQKNDELDQYKQKLEKIFKSTYQFFEIGNHLVRTSSSVNEQYLLRLFYTISSIFDKYEYASCYVDGGEYVRYIGAHGYNIDDLNALKFRSNKFNWDNLEPLVIKKLPESIQMLSKQKNITLSKDYPELKETVTFCISLEGDIRGGMSFDIVYPSKTTFNENDINLIRYFQSLMNSFYNNSIKTYKNMNVKNDIVFTMIRTLGMYDHYTGDHSFAVATLAQELSRRMNLSDEMVSKMYWGGLVHDIGKVGISQKILNKKTRLTKEEYDQIKKHPEFGYDLLSSSSTLQDIADIILMHHEWWNGNGYPRQLKYEEISVPGQILCVCDAVAAMACDRPYKTRLSQESIIDELKTFRGIQFSPKATDIMVALLEEESLTKYIFCNNKN